MRLTQINMGIVNAGMILTIIGGLSYIFKLFLSICNTFCFNTWLYFALIVANFVLVSFRLHVSITNDLKWNSHISNVCTKANRTLRFLRRNLYSYMSPRCERSSL